MPTLLQMELSKFQKSLGPPGILRSSPIPLNTNNNLVIDVVTTMLCLCSKDGCKFYTYGLHIPDKVTRNIS